MKTKLNLRSLFITGSLIAALACLVGGTRANAEGPLGLQIYGEFYGGFSLNPHVFNLPENSTGDDLYHSNNGFMFGPEIGVKFWFLTGKIRWDQFVNLDNGQYTGYILQPMVGPTFTFGSSRIRGMLNILIGGVFGGNLHPVFPVEANHIDTQGLALELEGVLQLCASPRWSIFVSGVLGGHYLWSGGESFQLPSTSQLIDPQSWGIHVMARVGVRFDIFANYKAEEKKKE